MWKDDGIMPSAQGADPPAPSLMTEIMFEDFGGRRGPTLASNRLMYDPRGRPSLYCLDIPCDYVYANIILIIRLYQLQFRSVMMIIIIIKVTY